MGGFKAGRIPIVDRDHLFGYLSKGLSGHEGRSAGRNRAGKADLGGANLRQEPLSGTARRVRRISAGERRMTRTLRSLT